MNITLFGFWPFGHVGMILLALAIYVFFFVLAIMLFRFLLGFPKIMKNLPDQIAERMIEKLREEERRKQAERNSDQQN